MGYSPDDEGWLDIGEFDQESIEHDAVHALLDAWEAETFGERASSALPSPTP